MNDPLAELARLIGQSKPHSEFSGESRAPLRHDERALHRDDLSSHFGGDGFAQQASDPVYHNPADPPEDRFGSELDQRYGANSGQRHEAEPTRHYGAEPSRSYNADQGRGYANEPAPRYSDPNAGWPGSPPPPQPSPSADPLAFLSDRVPPPHAAPDPHYDPHEFPDPRLQSGLDNFQVDPVGFDAHGYPAAIDRQGLPQGVFPHEQDGRRMPAPHGDEFYDDTPRGGGRKGVLTVAAVMALAVIGTAGAFGYRSIFGGSHSSAPPPVIRASGEPSKVAPPPAQTEQTVSKFSYDRFGDRGKDEQVVPREERPVDPKELARSSAPRTAAPAEPVANTASPQGPNSAMAMPNTPNPPSALGEPRRVHTVQIRPDRPEPAITPQTVDPMPLSAPSTAPAEMLAPPTRSAPPVAARVPPVRAANPRVAARAQAPAANAPLSLSPNASNAQQPPAPAQEIAPPQQAAPARTRLAAAPPAGGGYLVQVSSQRSESDAQSAFRNIQSKYSNVLGGQPHMVKRADLGSRGVYYRAMVGPFGSREQAIELCSSLKSAGGDCVVQSN